MMAHRRWRKIAPVAIFELQDASRRSTVAESRGCQGLQVTLVVARSSSERQQGEGRKEPLPTTTSAVSLLIVETEARVTACLGRPKMAYGLRDEKRTAQSEPPDETGRAKQSTPIGKKDGRKMNENAATAIATAPTEKKVRKPRKPREQKPVVFDAVQEGLKETLVDWFSTNGGKISSRGFSQVFKAIRDAAKENGLFSRSAGGGGGVQPSATMGDIVTVDTKKFGMVTGRYVSWTPARGGITKVLTNEGKIVSGAYVENNSADAGAVEVPSA